MKLNPIELNDNPSYRLGISGGMACGKSTLAQILLAELHTRGIEAHYLDVDTLRRTLLESRESALARELQIKLTEIFGSEILKAGGGINRRVLSEILFADKEALKLYEAIVDPIIFDKCAEFFKGKNGLLLLEWALLFEKKMLSLVNYNVLLVECSANVQLERLSGGDLAPSQVAKRIELQGSQEARFKNIVQTQRKAGYGDLFRIETDRNVSQDKLTELVDTLCASVQGRRYQKYG